VSHRWRPPVWSPLTPSALWAGLGAAMREARAGSALQVVEQWLEREFDAPMPLLTDSGTSALTLALRLCTEGGPVAIPAWGCYDLATAVLGAGCEAVLYDLDPGTLGPDWPSLSAALEQGARAVVVVHFFGIPVDFGLVRATLAARTVPIIEDAAQAIGARWGGQRCGALGACAVLSFGRGKGLTGSGGGALLIRDNRLWERARFLASTLGPSRRGVRSFAKGVAQWALGRPGWYWIPSHLPGLDLGETVYHPPRPPAPMSRASLGLLASATRGEAAAAATRRRGAECLLRTAPEELVRTVSLGGQGLPGYLRLPMMLRKGPFTASAFQQVRSQGVQRGYPVPLSQLPELNNRVLNGKEEFPGAQRLADRLVTLPTGWVSTDADATEIWSVVIEAVAAGTRQG
jgi:perosamine synthetase